MNLIALFTSLDGRINRKRYWVGWLAIIFVAFAAIVAIVITWGDDALNGPYSGSSALALLLEWLVVLASVPLMVKRLHDLNRSGHFVWPILILDTLLTAGDLSGVTGNETDYNAVGWTLMAVYGTYGLVLLVYLGFYRGTVGSNDFGPDPLAATEAVGTVKA
jgi:uncharacterized membrane protein YhaH (DUF805 family)